MKMHCELFQGIDSDKMLEPLIPEQVKYGWCDELMPDEYGCARLAIKTLPVGLGISIDYKVEQGKIVKIKDSLSVFGGDTPYYLVHDRPDEGNISIIESENDVKICIDLVNYYADFLPNELDWQALMESDSSGHLRRECYHLSGILDQRNARYIRLWFILTPEIKSDGDMEKLDDGVLVFLHSNRNSTKFFNYGVAKGMSQEELDEQVLPHAFDCYPLLMKLFEIYDKEDYWDKIKPEERKFATVCSRHDAIQYIGKFSSSSSAGCVPWVYHDITAYEPTRKMLNEYLGPSGLLSCGYDYHSQGSTVLCEDSIFMASNSFLLIKGLYGLRDAKLVSP